MQSTILARFFQYHLLLHDKIQRENHYVRLKLASLGLVSVFSISKRRQFKYSLFQREQEKHWIKQIG
ncbi:hypothetical protein FGO68_gene14933 [Halteria grandinella]|uniref:Uncharacterized protein n=1 Tax=Halteria grandinella TaxID=5974 RepID=A0A8J8N9J4_HALGN|nr:hypothetical protein FGO68_gene14933 [Halteria grandinella]